MPITDPRFLESSYIDWRTDYETVQIIQKEAEDEAGEGKTESFETDMDLSEVDLNDESFWEDLEKNAN